MYVFITLLVIFLVLFSCACLYMTVCIDLCALTPPVCGLSFISIKFCSVLFCSDNAENEVNLVFGIIRLPTGLDFYFLYMRREFVLFLAMLENFYLAHGLRQLIRNVKCDVRTLNFMSDVIFAPPRKIRMTFVKGRYVM